MVILDTDLVSLLQAEDSKPKAVLSARLRVLESAAVATTIVTYEEQMRGWLAYKARAKGATQEAAAYAKLKSHIENYRTIIVLDFDQYAAAEYQRLRARRIRIGAMDLKIASTAILHDSTLAARNLADFRKVPGLRVEDWTVKSPHR
jgi:tRNA(fMet)-specific endonuclease VapC